jgi:hypothetical protein
MNPVLVSLITVAIHIAVVYFGIQRFNLSYWSMMGLVLLTSVLLTAVTKVILPPSSLIKDLHKRLTTTDTESVSEMTFLDGISLVGVVATAYLLVSHYGALQWFGIYIASCITTLLAYMLL